MLVTGGAGFIGSHTVDLLLKQGYQVRILDSLTPPVHVDGNIPDFVSQKDTEFIEGNVRDRTAWERALEGVEAVFHLAAYQDYLPDFSTFFHTNTVSTALLYEVIVEKKLPVSKVVVASSQAAYGEGKYRCVAVEAHGETGHDGSSSSDSPVQYPGMRSEAQLRRGQWDVGCPVCSAHLDPQWTDEAVVNPHNSYAISKYTQELVALNLGRRHNIPTACVRYSIVQGARQSFRNAYSGVLRIFTQRILHGRPPICYEDGQQLRDYVSVHDVVRANLLVLNNESVDYQVINVGGDRRVSVLEYARLVAKEIGVSIEPQVTGVYRFGDARHSFSDVSRLKGLGWAVEVPLESIVKEYVDWAQAQAGFRDYSSEAEVRMETLGTIRRIS